MSGMEVSGRLVSFPISDLLNWASNERRTGSLIVRRSSREKRIYFREGQVVGCLSDTTLEYYGKHLLLEGYVSKDDLVRCLLICQQTPGRRLGSILIDEGVLSAEVVERTLTEHVEDMVCDIFLWRRGLFFFRTEGPLDEISVSPIHPLRLVLEGSRWIDEVRQIRQVFPHDQLLVQRVRGRQSADDLGRRAAFIVRELVRATPLAKLYAAVGGSYFRFLDEVHGLVKREVLEVVDQGRHSASTSAELPISELLMEQAAEEDVLASLQDFAVPLHLLEPYYPARSREPDVEQRAGLSAAESEFLERLDGKRTLKEVLAQEREERSAQLEILLLLMSKGLLAFIPPPAEEVGG